MEFRPKRQQLDPSEFTVDHSWFSGPPFLQGLDEWPQLKALPLVEESDPEIRETSWVGLIQRESDEIDVLIERKSRSLIIFNTVAYFIASSGTPVKRTVTSVQQANSWSKKSKLAKRSFSAGCNIMSSAFQQEVNDLRARRPIEEIYKIIKLTPNFDQHGLMCVGRRLEKTPLPIDARHPIILPCSERMTELILFKLHPDRGHLLASQLHHEARQQNIGFQMAESPPNELTTSVTVAEG